MSKSANVKKKKTWVLASATTIRASSMTLFGRTSYNLMGAFKPWSNSGGTNGVLKELIREVVKSGGFTTADIALNVEAIEKGLIRRRTTIWVIIRQ